MGTEYLNLGGATAVIVALVSVCKKAGFPSKYAGLLAIIFGEMAVFGMCLQSACTDYFLTVVAGVVLGLTAAGAYSGSKAVLSDER